MLSFSDLFWPMFAAMIASTVVIELAHLALTMYLTRKQMRRYAALQEEMAKKFPDGIPLEQLDFLGGSLPGGLSPMKLNPKPASKNDPDFGQYL